MNYMEQVAQMLGLELEEEFYIKGNDNKFKITNNGMCYSFRSTDMWSPVSWIVCDILNGKLEITKKPKPILTKQEKEYLSNVIKPFRNKIESIAKYIDEDGEYISITYKDLNGGTFSMAFPSYDDGTMYKGMELNKIYTLEELGL